MVWRESHVYIRPTRDDEGCVFARVPRGVEGPHAGRRDDSQNSGRDRYTAWNVVVLEVAVNKDLLLGVLYKLGFMVGAIVVLIWSPTHWVIALLFAIMAVL